MGNCEASRVGEGGDGLLLFNGYQAVAQGVKKSWEQWCWLHILNVFKVTAYLVVAKSVSFILCEFHCHKNKLKVIKG